MTEGIEYRDDSWPKTMHGHADVREFLEAIWRATPDMTFELLAGPYVIPGEPRAAFHWRGGGTHTGPLEPPGFAPTGRAWELDGVDFHEYRDGRVHRLRIAFDMLSASRQLGLMPATGSRAERLLALTQPQRPGCSRRSETDAAAEAPPATGRAHPSAVSRGNEGNSRQSRAGSSAARFRVVLASLGSAGVTSSRAPRSKPAPCGRGVPA